MTYSKIKHNFATKCYDYSNNAIVQQQVKSELFNQILKYTNNVKNILNIGIRDINEPILLSKCFNAVAVDAIDMTLDGIDITNKPHNIRLYEINFDHNLDKINNHKYDLVFSNMSLQWSKDFYTLLNNINTSLNKNGILAFSIPLSNNFSEISNILRTNSFLSLEEASNIIDNNFKCLLKKEICFNLNFTNLKELITHIKNTGVNSYTGSDKLINFSTIKQLLKQPKQISLTYHIGIFIYQKDI